MPIPVRSRRYDERFWQEVTGRSTVKKDPNQILKELGY